ncbi:MAG: hypothetical protein HY984_01780 [Candidatus Magasanikbacteria bacterium]|nr:hypothetical protein [Candidatus Magasanikbacteria bacterium]
MDAITALSGSGPAYFFYLTELLAKQAEAYGFTEDIANILAKQTLLGAAALLTSDPRSPTDWKRAVMSKGGTTEAAMKSLNENDFEKIFFKALDQAKNRSKELRG